MNTPKIEFKDKFDDVLTVNRSDIGSLYLQQKTDGDNYTSILLDAPVAEQFRDLVNELFPKAPEPVASPDVGVFFLLRQKVGKPSKVKVCFAPEYGVDNKEYKSLATAQRAARRQNEQYGTEWNYFVVEKETV